MGIDLWVERSAAGVTPQTSPAAHEVIEQKSLAELSGIEFNAAVAGLKVTCSEPAREADLLVITDGPDLTGECTKLLDSMFKAIELNRSQWLHAGISPAEDALPISQLGESVKPKSVLMMISTGGDAAALASLRGKMHRPQALQAFVVASFHPQDLLDNPSVKRPAWEDLKQLRQWLG